jgi:NarL family two-component system response regulator LiaR
MSARRYIQAVIVDEYAMVRRGLRVALGTMSDLEVAGQVWHGLEVLQLREEQPPDVILMDLRMPLLDRAQATRLIRNRWPQVQVLVLTSFQESKLIRGELQARAYGYLPKNVSARQSGRAIRAGGAGQSTLSQQVLQTLAVEEDANSRSLLDGPGTWKPALSSSRGLPRAKCGEQRGSDHGRT